MSSDCTVLVHGHVLLGAVLGQQAVRVLVHAQLVQRGEILAAEVAAVTQLLLVALDVLKEGLQLLEGLGTGLHHTFVHLAEGRKLGRLTMDTSWEKPVPTVRTAFLSGKKHRLSGHIPEKARQDKGVLM